jgi:hypothetical protein
VSSVKRSNVNEVNCCPTAINDGIPISMIVNDDIALECNVNDVTPYGNRCMISMTCYDCYVKC